MAEEALQNEQYLRVPPLFQIVAVATTSLLLGVIIWFASTAVYIRDSYAPVLVVTPQKLAEFGGIPAEVTVGMYVRDFPKFDMVKDEFIVDAVLWFKFDPRLVALDRLKDFTFEKASILSKSAPVVRVSGKDIIARFDLRIKFNVLFDYRDFPFDNHRLNLVLSHYFFSPSEVMFVANRSQFVISPEIATMGWECVDWRTNAGYWQEKFETRDARQSAVYPRVAFTIDYERVGIRHVISIVIPLLLIFFIALFTFSLEPIKYRTPIITLSVTTVTALIAYRFVIENLSPEVGYFMISDTIFLLFLVACCLIFFVNMLGERVSRLMKIIISLALHAAVLATFLTLFA